MQVLSVEADGWIVVHEVALDKTGIADEDAELSSANNQERNDFNKSPKHRMLIIERGKV